MEKLGVAEATADIVAVITDKIPLINFDLVVSCASALSEAPRVFCVICPPGVSDLKNSATMKPYSAVVFTSVSKEESKQRNILKHVLAAFQINLLDKDGLESSGVLG